MPPKTRTRKTGGASSSSRPRSSDSTPDSQRARYEARQARTRARTAAGAPRRSEDATSIAEALDIEREQGRREGRRMAPVRAPAARYGKYRTQAYGGSEPNRAPRSAPVRVQAPSLGPAPGVAVPMLVDLAIISADSIAHERRPPVPSRLLVVFTLFGILGLVGRGGPEASRLSSAVGWSVVLATFYNSAAPGKAPLGIGALGTLGNFLSGKYANPKAPKHPTEKHKGTSAPKLQPDGSMGPVGPLGP